MILLPIGRDDAVIQRHAWVSYVIIALNIVVFIAMSMAEHGQAADRAQAEWRATMQYYIEHPYLRMPADVEPLVPAKVRNIVRGAEPPAVLTRSQRSEEQSELERLAGRLESAYHQLPLIRFGYQPAEGGWLNVLTSMFIHADLMHIVGNLLFFFVTGPFIEDVFG